jgi:hypothetical protein
MVEPAFWSGKDFVPKETYTIDFGGKIPPVEEVKEQVLTMFKDVGLVVLKNTGLPNLDAMEPYSQILVDHSAVYEGGANPRKGIQKNFYVVGAPPTAHLHYHHEMAYVRESVKMLAFCCNKATEGKGWSFVSSAKHATDEIMQTELGKKLRERGLCYVRCLPDRREYENDDNPDHQVYNFWQRSFLTEDPEEAEKMARQKGLDVEWGVDPLGRKNYMITKFYVSAFEYDPNSDRNYLYSSVADHSWWFDQWPGVMEFPHDKRPLQLLFGDGSELTYEEWCQWIGLNDKYGIPVRWSVGDIAFVCNHRWAHGRPGYHLEEGEERELGVRLGKVYTRIGDLPDKWEDVTTASEGDCESP